MIPVIFRAERSGKFKGEVTAVFPDFKEPNGDMTCYAHVGQHSNCSPEWYYSTRAARPDEYADLLAELQGIYSDDQLIVRTRRNIK